MNQCLAHSIANFADEVVTLVGALKEQLDVICDANIQLGSPRSKQARRDAKEILHMLKSNSAEVHERCKEIHHVTSLVMTPTDSFTLIGMRADLDLVQDTNPRGREGSERSHRAA